MYSVKAAGSYTPSAALADILIYKSFTGIIRDRIRSALPRAQFAVSADALIHHGFSVIMLLHFPGTAAATHTNVLDSAAKAGLFVTFKMCKRNGNMDGRENCMKDTYKRDILIFIICIVAFAVVVASKGLFRM